jgi:hypothetical protein
MARQVISIIAVAQTPPPFHGQAVMNQLLLEGDYSKVQFHHVRMAFSDDIQEVGVFRWKKIFHLVVVYFGIVVALFRTGAQVLYYPPASPNMVPFLRDCVLLIGTRWLFQKTVSCRPVFQGAAYHNPLHKAWANGVRKGINLHKKQAFPVGKKLPATPWPQYDHRP